MKIKFDFGFKTLWLFASGILLALPIFVPSYPDAVSFFGNTVLVASSALFVISLPFSLPGLLLSTLIQTLWDINPLSIQGLYLQALTFFVAGYFQWFVVAPRVLKKFSLRKHQLALEEMNHVETKLPTAFDESGYTPLENILKSDEEKEKVHIKE